VTISIGTELNDFDTANWINAQQIQMILALFSSLSKASNEMRIIKIR
jgi:hypothetical protein